MVVYGEEVYWKLKEPVKESEFESVMDRGSFWPYSAFFCASLTNKETPSNLSQYDLRQIASEVIGVAVDAFDAESFVLWWREDLHPFPLATETPDVIIY